MPLWSYECVLDTFTVLAEPNRRQILDLLCDGEVSVGELVEKVGLSQPAVSKHLRVLRESGMVEVRSQGPQRLYRLDPAPLRELDDWLMPYRRRWRGALDLLDDHLAATRPATTPPEGDHT